MTVPQPFQYPGSQRALWILQYLPFPARLTAPAKVDDKLKRL
jgi:hypothetical protein